MESLASEDHRNAFRIIVNHLCRLHLNNAAFPGGMPMALTKERFQDILKPNIEHYVWSPKADGVRMFLLFTSLNKSTEPRQVLIDRAWTMCLVKLQIPVCFYDGTILDGEWLSETGTFLVFDILAVCGLPLDKTFAWSARRQILEHVVNLITPMAQEKGKGFKCVLKPFYPLATLPSFKQDNFFSSDGIILTRQDMPLCFFRDTSTLKWKSNTKQTVDLFVQYCKGPGVTHPVRLYAFQGRRPVLYREQTEEECSQCPNCPERNDTKQRPPLSSLVRHVVEFEPCMAISNPKIIWHPLSIRSDKAYPNSIPVIQDTERLLSGDGVSWDHLLSLVPC